MSSTPERLTVLFDEQLYLELQKRVSSESFGPPNWYRLRLQAEELALSPGFDQLLSLDANNIDEYPHQIEAACTALREMRGRALLADEVGLGKTIEAGIIMKELLLRGLARKVLILTPASLCVQWQQEMENKFNERFIINDDPDTWDKHDRVIASLDLAKRLEHAERITKVNYDLLIVDEAHKLRNRASLSWKLVNSIRRKYLLLLTATPVHNDLSELYSLVTLLRPGLLRTYRAFRRSFVNPMDPRRPINRATLKRLLSQCMIRNRRGHVSVYFPPRTAYTYRVALSQQEIRLYGETTNLIRQCQASPQDAMTLILLQQEVVSSAAAARSTLVKLARKNPPEQLRPALIELCDLAHQIGPGAKADALAQIVEKAGDKVIVFTDFRATQEVICKHLGDRGVSVVEFHGGLSAKQKEEAVQGFRDKAQVMVSTESGSEGRNLQFCNVMVNYDLPWDPMLIEQRMGRIHRLGQEREVFVFNLAARDTIEDYILDLLANKIRMFELVIGELDLILGEMSGEETFEKTLRRVALTGKTDEDVKQELAKLGHRVDDARNRFSEIKEAEMLVSKIFDDAS